MYKELYRRFYPRCIPTRGITCLMLFTCCWTTYMCRLQMPILAVPMIETSKTTSTLGACQKAEEKSNSERRRRAAWFDSDSYLDYWINDRQEAQEDERSHVILRRATNDTNDMSNLKESELNLTLGQIAYDNKYFRSIRKIEIRDPDARIELFSGKSFKWSADIRGQLIASYSYGNVPGNLIGALMTMKIGPRLAIFWTSFIAATVSLISPIIAQMHWGALAFTRVIIGLSAGTTFPACHTMVAKWAPPNEKSRFVWSLLGGTFGTIFTYPMIAGIAENINWEAGWYIPALLMYVWIVFWMLLAYDSPEEHPGISDAEKEYILSSQAGTVRKRNPTLKETPLSKILTSIPFISLAICHSGNMFLLFFYQNSMMLYLTKTLGFHLAKGGVVASLPWAGRMLFGFFFSWAGDTIKKKQLLSVTMLRKGATIFSHLLPGICLIIVGYLGCSFILANLFLVIALAFNGAASIANLSNNQDLSPNFAGFIYGVMNTIGSVSGMIIPIMVETIAGKHGNTVERWRILFWIGGSICILGMAVFLVGGSGKIQSWNEIAEDPKQEEARNAETKADGTTSPDRGTKV